MSIVNLGDQTIYVDYKQEVTSESFNRTFRGILKAGVYAGGELTTTDGTQIIISPFTAFFNSKFTGTTDDTLAVAIKTASAITLSGSSFIDDTKTYVCMKYEWDNVLENYIDFYVRNIGSGVEDNEIILGVATYGGGIVTGFDYIYRTFGMYDEDLDLMNLPQTVIRGGCTTIGDNDVTGNSEIDGTLTVNDLATFTAGVDITSPVTIDGGTLLNYIKLASYPPVGATHFRTPSAKLPGDTLLSNAGADITAVYNPGDVAACLYPGTTWKLDVRAGDFLRQVGGGGGASVGVEQDDQLQGHRFFIMKNSNNGLIATPFVSVTGSDAAAQRGSDLIADTGSTSDPITDGTNGAPRTGSETRPTNTAVEFWVRTV